ncbi:uncharacterized protein LOC135703948 [Ochlerotatus camptorhynchus]|uniref:uncharacterized protein LOC135703948 n=1 Tax=Ochlerotatus camptorhynchus TaxID=644619 RepID=UPI0031CF2A8B
MHWLSSLPSRWQMFVANRVSEIQHITKGFDWNHVAGLENPADIVPRGMIPAQLQYSTIWFEGPPWLRRDSSTWRVGSPEEDFEQSLLEERSAVAIPAQSKPHSDIFSLHSSLSTLIRKVAWIRRFIHNCHHREERRNGYLSLAIPAQSKPHSDIFSLHSSLSTLIRKVAWIRRFIHNCHHREERRNGYLSHADLQEAMLSLIRLSQRESFPEEISALQSGNQVKPSSSINRLTPILVDGVLYVGGRLSKAPIPASRKHPAILSYHHPLSKLVVIHYHQKLFHAGQQLLISRVREKYWPTQIRRLANTVINECVPCFPCRPKVLDQLMADFPSERVTPAPPFLKVGVDYCGPFLVAYRTTPRKYFVAIFVCLVTKAVHLELVGDLTSEAFLAAFKRFAARRGKPTLFQQSIVNEAEEDEIEFRFIPARSPNFGGLWEAAVKSFKSHFKRTIGSRTLLHDEMQTVIVQVEAILNSRPLTPISNDPTDFEALTPGHFLFQRPLTAVPEPDLSHIPENRLSLWQKSQDFVQQIWNKWSSQYLSDLHNRTKWTRRRNNISVDTMVLVKEDNLPPMKWKLGRVVEVHAGSDGNIRVVTVRTKDGLFRRAITKICVLPIRDNQAVPTSEEN